MRIIQQQIRLLFWKFHVITVPMVVVLIVCFLIVLVLVSAMSTTSSSSCCRYSIVSSSSSMSSTLSLYSSLASFRMTPPRQRQTLSSSTTTTTLHYSNYNRKKNSLFTQVICDVDDTLKSSGGITLGGIPLGGIDVQYKRGTIYPGVIEFIYQLSVYNCMYQNISSIVNRESTNTTTASPANSSNRYQPQSFPANVAIVTARAEEFKVALEIKSNNPLAIQFRQVGTRYGNMNGWGIGPVLYGSVVEWIIQQRKGLRKFSNFEKLIQLSTTSATTFGQPKQQQHQQTKNNKRNDVPVLFQYIYVGDTGELDQEAGEAMLREYPHLVQAVFLHVVYGTLTKSRSISNNNNNNTQQIQPTSSSSHSMKWINGRPLIFFRTYVGAAVAAVQLNLMSMDGLCCVMNAAKTQLESITADNTNGSTASTSSSSSSATVSSFVSQFVAFLAQPQEQHQQQHDDDKWIDLNRDLERATKLIQQSKHY